METEEYYKNEKSFEGKNIVITGASGEIGFDVATAFLRLGANKVIAVGKNERKIKDKFCKNVKTFKIIKAKKAIY
jgi:NAD(P)-dependent dehydrogenase (short-subunit alcohol dehydrogenase family)